MGSILHHVHTKHVHQGAWTGGGTGGRGAGIQLVSTDNMHHGVTCRQLQLKWLRLYLFESDTTRARLHTTSLCLASMPSCITRASSASESGPPAAGERANSRSGGRRPLSFSSFSWICFRCCWFRCVSVRGRHGTGGCARRDSRADATFFFRQEKLKERSTDSLPVFSSCFFSCVFAAADAAATADAAAAAAGCYSFPFHAAEKKYRQDDKRRQTPQCTMTLL